MSSRTTRGNVRSVARGAVRASTLLGAATLAANAALGQTASRSGDADEVEVIGERLEEGLGTRYTAPLLETPQTITIVPRDIMDQQNLLTMRDILSTLPGITFTAGEGGGGYGDGVNLRGYSATNDISTDGVRDSAQYTRSDPFNLEQLELVSGANSVYTGAGSVGGSINLVTKTPTGRPGTVVGLSAGEDSYSRLTLDSEVAAGDVADVRLNLMRHENDVPGRDVERYERWGFAPSVGFGLGTDTRLTLAYLHQEDDNIPQYGVPFALGAFNSGPLAEAPSSAYYGYRNVDTQDTTIDSLTAVASHSFNDRFRVRNLTRWQQVDNFTIASHLQGAWCSSASINPWTGAACTSPGTFQPSGRSALRDTSNDVLANQTDFTVDFATGAIEHTLVTGFSLSRETYHRDTGNPLRNPLGATPNPTLPVMQIANPDNFYAGPINHIITQTADGEVANRAAYIFDRVQLSDQLELNGGVRLEHNDASNTTAAIATPYPAPPARPVITQGPVNENTDNLFSYRLGLVYKPTADSSVYIAHGNSETPSQSSVNGTCDVLTSCNVDPEQAETLEIGGKWELRGGLTLTAAVFRNERTNFRVASGDALIPEQQLDGNSRVDGVALGAVGQIGERASIFTNYTYLDSKVVQSISDHSLAGGTIDINAGDPLPNTPKHAASVWGTYRVSDAFMFGYGMTYQGEFSFGRFSASSPLYFTDDYWVHRAMATYSFNDQLALQVNLNNVTDEDYLERIRNNSTNGWATPGAARSVVLALNYRL